jgi:hypothetical protein
MPCTVSLHPQLPLVELTVAGLPSISEVAAGLQEAMKLIAACGRGLVLADCSGLQGGHTITDLYRLVEGMGPALPPVRLREAVLLPSAGPGVALAGFWETICVNRGINVRVFTDRAEAMIWLTADWKA